MEKLPREFYIQDTLKVAKSLLGKNIVHVTNGESLTGKIVETEAYIGPLDKASHSYNNRRTSRNEIMYGPPGFVYIFIIYGMHYCLNIVTGGVNNPEAVLIRGLEPLNGLDTISQNRYKKDYNMLTSKEKINLSNGPGKLCKSLGIDMSNYGDDLCGNSIYITKGNEISDSSIACSPRINIDYAEEARDYPWRYYIKNNNYVSRIKTPR